MQYLSSQCREYWYRSSLYILYKSAIFKYWMRLLCKRRRFSAFENEYSNIPSLHWRRHCCMLTTMERNLGIFVICLLVVFICVSINHISTNLIRLWINQSSLLKYLFFITSCNILKPIRHFILIRLIQYYRN